MQYSTINNQKISRLGYGCMRYPLNAEGTVDKEAALKLMDYAYSRGITYYDTAMPYHNGESEIILGHWLKTIDRCTVAVADKMSMWLVESADKVADTFENQLEKLQTDYIDFYLIHSLNKDYWQKVLDFKLLDFLVEKKKEGKIRHIGFSFHDDFDFFKEVLASHPWDFCQIQLNYMDVDFQAGTKGLKYASELGMPVVIMEPLKGGLLAALPPVEKAMLQGKYTDGIAGMRWVASQPGVSVMLSGIVTEENITDNTEIFNNFVPFNQEELDIFTEINRSLSDKILVPCTACQYCLPCPFEVDIPSCFKFLNNANRYDNYKKVKGTYNFHVPVHKASTCTDCQVCVSKCPQNIDIPAKLKLVVEKLES